MKKFLVSMMAGMMMLGSMPSFVSANENNEVLSYSSEYNLHPLILEFFLTIEDNMPSIQTTFYLGEGVYVTVTPNRLRRAAGLVGGFNILSQPVVGTVMGRTIANSTAWITATVTAHQNNTTWHHKSASPAPFSMPAGWIPASSVHFR